MNRIYNPVDVYENSYDSQYSSSCVKPVAVIPTYKPLKNTSNQSSTYPINRELMIDFMYIKIPALEILDMNTITLILAWDDSIYNDRVILSWRNRALKNGSNMWITVEKGSGKWHRIIGETLYKYRGSEKAIRYASKFARMVGLK